VAARFRQVGIIGSGRLGLSAIRIVAGTVRTDSFGEILCQGADGNGPGIGGLSRHAKVGFWHNPDLQRPLELGPIMAALPTFGAECLVIVAFQTQFRGAPKVGS